MRGVLQGKRRGSYGLLLPTSLPGPEPGPAESPAQREAWRPGAPPTTPMCALEAETELVRVQGELARGSKAGEEQANHSPPPSPLCPARGCH